jgi:DeoR/GlpR family transcriptional regulator of sugar metabolism
MFTEERQQKIMELIQQTGKIRISQLTEQFGVSEVTLRNDLSTLARKGYLTRTHGGALLQENSIFPGKARLSFGGKDVPNLAAKRAIGKKAVEYVESGMNILLDAGTTILEIARNLHGFRDLTVITDSIPVAVELSGEEEITVLLTGGVLRPASLAVIGPESWSMLENIHVQRAFIGARGVSAERGFFCGNSVEGETKRRMMAVAEEKFAVVDASKFGASSLVPFADIADFDYLLTDSVTDNNLAGQLAGKIEIVTCNSSKSSGTGAKK